ncbi:MAG: adenosine deaminase [Proteobacteria bacterium]|nr:adenosine deaminase [Pseudomonadota bacterium]
MSFSYIENLPKAELHLHLEGSVTPSSWYKLLKKHSNGGEIESVETLSRRFEFSTFIEFLAAYKDVLDAIKDPSDFYDLTKDLLNSLVAQSVRYCEVMFTPYFMTQKGIDLQEILQEIKRALTETKKTGDIDMKLIFDGPRNFGNEVVRQVFNHALEDRTGLVIGVGLGGDEAKFPARQFVDEFDFARSQGLQLIAHAGETAGEQSMVDAIELLGVSRIGHALGISENSHLEHLILEKNITLDLCPWSNVATGVIDSINEHPFPRYHKNAYPVTLNTDDPGFFFTSLVKEYGTMQSLYQLTSEDLIQISKNSISGSFMGSSDKTRLLEEINQSL